MCINNLAICQTLSISETAELLHISRDSVRKMIKKGELKSLRFCDRLVRVPISEINKVLGVNNDQEAQ